MKIISVNEAPTIDKLRQLEKEHDGEVKWIEPVPMRTPKKWKIHIQLNDPNLDAFMGKK